MCGIANANSPQYHNAVPLDTQSAAHPAHAVAPTKYKHAATFDRIKYTIGNSQQNPRQEKPGRVSVDVDKFAPRARSLTRLSAPNMWPPLHATARSPAFAAAPTQPAQSQSVAE